MKVKVRAETTASSFLLQALPARWLPTGSPAHGHSGVMTTGAAEDPTNKKSRGGVWERISVVIRYNS